MFPPEFRNRLTEFIVFRALERNSLYLILQKLLNISAERFAALGFQLVLSTPRARLAGRPRHRPGAGRAPAGARGGKVHRHAQSPSCTPTG